ncbi:MAG: type 3 dihydrofolate reductase [Gammaproteobacteria bacterium]|jgi:dihydrofolate reductase|nr:type 3 dihydrofolate reductase [Gammaproteobacteria bacterium]MBT6043839.1 type 3 dihydrofolate reductase [Gammaproteobacteria bacterium]
MKISLVWAMAQNRIIGRNNNLPWHLPEDLKYFKRITLGKPVIMGRKTFESIGKPLPGRTNIVVTRNADFSAEGVKTVNSLSAAKALCESIGEIDGISEAMVIGGAEIYTQAMPVADRLYLTEVHANVDGDTFFPEFDRSLWKEVAREDFDASGPNPYAYSFIVLDKS